MATNSVNTEFQFVNSTVDTPKVPENLAIRALIRKQAMKKASAARRRDGNYGKHNLRQYPIFLFDQENAMEQPSGSQNWNVDKEPLRADLRTVSEPRDAPRPYRGQPVAISEVARVETIPRKLSARGYELTSMKSDFDVNDLSTLSSLHVNRAARAALSQNPCHLIYQLRSHKQSSYLSYLPSRYGQIPCLSDATDCVIARARQIISPNRGWEAAVITFYLKALDSLQKALDNPKQRFKPEVLCATEILALYELLDPSGGPAWVRHAAGAARLVQLRGPHNYRTGFEKALLMAHTGSIMTECLLLNTHCFLEQPAWKDVMRSATMDDVLLADRSEIVIKLMVLKSNIPGFFTDITKLMLASQFTRKQIETLALKIYQLRVDLQAWNREYENILNRAPEIYLGSPEYDRKCEVFATYLSCVIIISRLLGVVSPTERVELEEETGIMAKQMLDMELEVKATKNSAAALFMAQTLGVAQATLATSEDWLQGERIGKLESISPEGFVSQSPESTDSRDEPTGLIDFWKFERWNTMCGRKMF
ncbi:hypothetical protein BJ878DRAFT_510021 [Calycina marina]|uniref:Uncharacterized protein n=1 Tax=Calycina marina TaxID=1763456 RepID=A0A9P8CE11_9HELO|nr:hypothetical protein BJ878DRAFT_510021 [Calycina marina]